MQLCNPAATCEQRWNWRENVRGGLAILASKRASALAYLNLHRVGGSLPNDQGFADAEVVRRETIQRYNRAPYWVWDAAANLWRKSPPNNYVFLVLGS